MGTLAHTYRRAPGYAHAAALRVRLTLPIQYHAVLFHVWPTTEICGKEVASPDRASPCKPSFNQL